MESKTPSSRWAAVRMVEHLRGLADAIENGAPVLSGGLYATGRLSISGGITLGEPPTATAETDKYRGDTEDFEAVQNWQALQQAGERAQVSGGGGVIARLKEALDYGQFADDFDQPLAKPIRRDVRNIIAELSTPQARHCEYCDNNREVDTETDPTVRPCPKCREPAPTVDGGAVKMEIAPFSHAGMEHPCHPETCCCPDYNLVVDGEVFTSGDRLFCVAIAEKLRKLTHPTPQADVAQLVGAARRAEQLIRGTDAEFISVNSTADVGLGQLLHEALAPFTTARPKTK